MAEAAFDFCLTSVFQGPNTNQVFLGDLPPPPLPWSLGEGEMFSTVTRVSDTLDYSDWFGNKHVPGSGAIKLNSGTLAGSGEGRM